MPLRETSTLPSNLNKLVNIQLEVWPEHEKYLSKRFANNDEEFLKRVDDIAALVLKLIEGKAIEFHASYRWMCENFIEEDLHFRRTKSYRYSSFEEVNNFVYNDFDYMSKYVQGILLSQIFWHNHAIALDYFRTSFLENLPFNTRYLEIGPGHGLFLYFASQCKRIASLTAWDVSAASLDATQKALHCLGGEHEVNYVRQDILQSVSEKENFDAVVISEVLEHLEKPDVALRQLHNALTPSGKIYINIPINSPAPDHIFLWRHPEEFETLLEKTGFIIDEKHYIPATGYTLDRALKLDLSVSCVYSCVKR